MGRAWLFGLRYPKPFWLKARARDDRAFHVERVALAGFLLYPGRDDYESPHEAGIAGLFGLPQMCRRGCCRPVGV